MEHVQSFRLLATTSADGTAKIWKTADWTVVSTLQEKAQRWVWDCAFSEDSQYIITGKYPPVCVSITAAGFFGL